MALPNAAPYAVCLNERRVLRFFVRPNGAARVCIGLHRTSQHGSGFRDRKGPCKRVMCVGKPLRAITRRLGKGRLDVSVRSGLCRGVTTLTNGSVSTTGTCMLRVSSRARRTVSGLPCDTSAQRLLAVGGGLVAGTVLSSITDVLASTTLRTGLVGQRRTGGCCRRLTQGMPTGCISSRSVDVLGIPRTILSGRCMRVTSESIRQDKRLTGT